MRKGKKGTKGISLLEILVVVAIFSILGIMATRSVLLTIRGTKRSDSLLSVRENLNYSLSVIERQIRSAQSVPECPNADTSVIEYIDQYGNPAAFSCVDTGPTGYIASDSARLTSENVSIVSCSLSCVESQEGTPPSVVIEISAQDAINESVEKATVTSSTQIFLRTY